MSAEILQSNVGICCPGVKLFGQGFLVTDEFVVRPEMNYLRPYLSAADVKGRPKRRLVIDLFDVSRAVQHDEALLRERAPAEYDRLLRTGLHARATRSDRTQNAARYAKLWWLFGEPRAEFRKALVKLRRFLVTVESSRYRYFTFVGSEYVVEGSLIIVATEDAFHHAVLSSRLHVAWIKGQPGRLGVGNDPRYNKTRCFDRFPFPAYDERHVDTARGLGEELDLFRKKVLAEHQDLTMTGLYSVLEKLKAGEPLSAKEQSIHERGLVSVMKHLHEQIDAAAFDAYGWPHDLSDQEILARLVELNQERGAEEARGHVRWLRPEYQAPRARLPQKAEQTELDIAAAPVAAAGEKIVWPGRLPDRVTTVRSVLGRQAKPVQLEELARQFQRARRDDVQDVLNTLVALGLARQEDGRYIG